MIFAVNKPVGPTSRDIVEQVKRLTGKKVGHGGTLDPRASGVLVIATGADTKRLSLIVGSQKEYLAQIELGVISPTDDSEGPIKSVNCQIKPSRTVIIKTLSQFIGQISQVPPQFSAIKVKGKRSYRQARLGEKVEIAPRTVEIDSIELINYHYPIVECKIVCGKGVYIRALARDIGAKLSTGAYLKSLIRAKVGEYILEEAVETENLIKFLAKS